MKKTIIALLAAAALFPAGARADTHPCTVARTGGGDWPTLNGNLPSTNVQSADTTLTKSTVGSLTPAWRAQVDGYYSQPIVSGNCVYLTPFGSSGVVTALDIATGSVVWSVPAPLAGQTFAATVVDGTLFMNFPDGGNPKAVALDADTGDVLWRSPSITFGYWANQLASAKVFDGMQLVFTTGPDFDPAARPGYALIDTSNGAILHAQTVIPPEQLDDGFAGGGVWGTPAIDLASGYAFAGTANPDSKTKEHRYDNAIIKIDVARARDASGARVPSAEITNPRFGRIVDAYKGVADTIDDTLYNQPVCSTLGHQFSTPMVNVVCLQTDVDFGDSPTLWSNRYGELMLTQLQKSGHLHTVFADTMERSWTLKLAVDSTATITGGNSSQIATDGKTLYVIANPGVLWAIDGATGGVLWTTPTTGSVFAYMNVALVNGVLYTTTVDGVHAWDAATGDLLWRGGDAAAGGDWCFGATGSVAIAHHMVFSTCTRNELAETTSVAFAWRLP